jgi:hypothetical protein
LLLVNNVDFVPNLLLISKKSATKSAASTASSIEGTMIPDHLSITAICEWAAAFLTAWYLTSSLAAWYRLRHIPGPQLASFSYLWELHSILSDKTFDRFLNLREYGPLVRTAPGYIVTDDPEVLRKTMAIRGTYTRDAWYEGARFTPDSDNIVTQLNTAAHDALKAKTMSSYSGREIGTDLERAVDSQVVRLIDLVRRKYISKGDELRTVDFAPASRYFSLDVISLLLFGKAWGHLDEGTDVVGWVGAMDQALSLMTIAIEVPLLRTMLISKYGVLGFLGPKPTDKRGLGVVIRYVSRFLYQSCPPVNDDQHFVLTVLFGSVM